MATVLIVDDRPANITLQEQILSNAGYTVVSALDGEQGLKQAAEFRPDLIISDILMPNLDGFQFCHAIRTTPDYADIPFIFLTGAYVSEDDEAFALNLGANGFLRRPIKSQELLDVVHELIHSQSNMVGKTMSEKTDMDEQEFLKQHVARLTQALEDKVTELENVSEQNARLLEEAKNKEEQLHNSLEELQETQSYLVQSERLSAVGQLVSGVAHELNNPLAIILGYTQLVLRMPEASPRMSECLRKLEEAAQRCQRIIHHLTIFAQKHKVEKQYINVNDVIKSVIDVRLYQLQNDQIDVTTLLDPRLLVIYADFQQIQQVLLSIINNAQEALLTQSATQRAIQIETKLLSDMVAIKIVDNGPGIQESDLARLFEPFYTTKSFGQGMGLGLSVCYGVIKEHQGNIEVTNTEGGGATFTVTLPIYSVEEEGTATDGAEVTAKQYRILVIDDEPGILDILDSALRQVGYHVETTPRGLEGMKRATSEPFDLLLLDIKLLDSSGITLYEQLKESNPELAKKTVFITGDTIGHETQNFLEQHANPYITKPFDIDDVRRLVSKTLLNT